MIFKFPAIKELILKFLEYLTTYGTKTDTFRRTCV